MCRTPEEVTNELDAQADVAPHVQDDFDLEEGVLQELDVKDNPDFQVIQIHASLWRSHDERAGFNATSALQEKLHRRIANAPIKVLNPPRPGKKCLVLDIDYTIFDLNSTAGNIHHFPLPQCFICSHDQKRKCPKHQHGCALTERPEELARPHLHEFMTAVYEHYDLIIWSATGMKWIEVKMRELGVSTNPAYKLTAFMDHKSMVTIQTAKYGELHRTV